MARFRLNEQGAADEEHDYRDVLPHRRPRRDKDDAASAVRDRSQHHEEFQHGVPP